MQVLEDFFNINHNLYDCPTTQFNLTLIFNGKKNQISMNQKLQLSFIEKTVSTQVFVFKPTCLLVPIYQSSQVDKISICQDNMTLTLEGNQKDIQFLYERFSRVLSHKGFGEYYQTLKRLGRGNFATVYLVEHKYTKIKRAAKVFSRIGQGIQFMGNEALRNQIKTLKQIDHPNLVHFDGLYETQSLVYLVTEYLSGGTLDNALKSMSCKSGDFIQNVLKDLLCGLAYLDQNNIMHRDIKPENLIFRKEDSKWVIGDFGLAAHTDSNYLYNQCGTMGYMAPEVTENSENKKYGQSCDIYSLGVIAYQLIVGELPFRVESQSLNHKKLVWILFDRDQCLKMDPQIIGFLKKLLEPDAKIRTSPKQALESPFFKNSEIPLKLSTYHENKKRQQYDKILKMSNKN